MSSLAHVNQGRMNRHPELNLACVAGRRKDERKVKMSAGGRRYRDPPASDPLALHALVFPLSLPLGRLSRKLGLISLGRFRQLAITTYSVSKISEIKKEHLKFDLATDNVSLQIITQLCRSFSSGEESERVG